MGADCLCHNACLCPTANGFGTSIEFDDSPMKRNSHFWAWLLLFVSFVWGIEFSLVHLSLEHMGPNTFNALRFAIAVVSLLVWFFWSGKKIAQSLSTTVLKHGAVLGALLYVGFITQTIGLLSTTASNAGFITGLNCVMVPIVCWLWLKEKQAWYVWVGVASATLGTFLLTGGLSGFGIGEAWVMVCALCFAVHIVYTGLYVKNTDALVLTLVQLVVVTLLCTSTALLFERESLALIPELLLADGQGRSIAWLALLVGGVLGTALAYVAQTAGQQVLEPWRVALIFSTEPLFAAFGGYHLLNEVLTPMAWLGAAFIIAGVLLAELVSGDKSSATSRC